MVGRANWAWRAKIDHLNQSRKRHFKVIGEPGRGVRAKQRGGGDGGALSLTWGGTGGFLGTMRRGGIEKKTPGKLWPGKKSFAAERGRPFDYRRSCRKGPQGAWKGNRAALGKSQDPTKMKETSSKI